MNSKISKLAKFQKENLTLFNVIWTGGYIAKRDVCSSGG